MSTHDAIHAPGPHVAALERLTAALREEAGSWHALLDAARRQRAHVGAGNVAGVNEETGRMEALLRILDERAALRRRLLRELVGEPPCLLSEIESRLGCVPGAPLLRARAEVYRTARAVSSELVVNRSVLRRSLEGGEQFFRAVLAHLGEDLPQYGDPAHKGPDAGPSVFLNKVA